MAAVIKLDYINLISLGLTFLQAFLDHASPNLPAEVLSAIQAAVAALARHKADLVTKANLEAQRG